MKIFKKVLIFSSMAILVVAIIISLAGPTKAFPPTPLTVNLGAADSFAVLAGSAVTNVPTSVITGDLGLSPAAGTFYDSGVTQAQVSGTIYTTNAAGPAGYVMNPTLLTAAKQALTDAISDASGRTPYTVLASPELGGSTTTAGLYNYGTLQITGILTLDGQGDPDAVFIFKADTTLTTAVGSEVRLINGASACNVFWVVGTSVSTLGANSIFKGTIMADQSITLNTGANVEGRLLASSAAVTMQANIVTKPTCSVVAPTLQLLKTVTNDNGGTATNTDWTLAATGASGSPTNLSGTTTVSSGVTFQADTYTLSESGGPAGYTSSTYSCVKNGVTTISNTITLVSGDVAVCTINNNDIAPLLTITKTVNNTHGGIKTTSSFSYFIDGVTTTLGVASTTSIGVHTVSESADSGYLATFGGDCSLSGTTTLALGESKTCTITNNDIAPLLTVTKVVVNDSGVGTKTVSDFTLFIDGFSVVSGIASTTVVGLHTVSETADSGYTSVIGGDCNSDGTITLVVGDTKICTITNNDIVPQSSGGGGSYSPLPVPPLIDIIKVPSPLALPGGSGLVTYTYTLRNVGTVPVNNIKLLDDSCSSLNLVLGDINGNSKLEKSEVWTYRCSMVLTKTHTNIVVATGWANGVSATDIANATVVVGLPVDPPLIHVTKIPSPLALLSNGGFITYTEKITNPGTVTLNNVRLSDDKCSPVKYISGDINKNNKLETTETWVYTCKSNLTKTTTNTATATGEANGLIATDFAIATVVVATADVAVLSSTIVVPKLPNTGLAPLENMSLWSIGLVGIFIILVVSYIFWKKQIKKY